MSKEKNIKATELECCPVKPHTTKSWVLALVLGVFIGLAVIVPGVSGSTIAIIFGLYTSMLYAFGHILGDFKRCFKFLFPIGIGVVVGFVAGFLVIQKVFELYLFQIICLFVGLMIGAIPALTKEIKGERASAPRCVLFVVGLIIPIAISIFSIMLSGGEKTTASFTDFPLWRVFAYLPLGFIVSVTQIVPGLSATAILMAFGQFKPILNSLHSDYIFANPKVLLLYAALGIGFLAGIVCVSRAFSAIIAKNKGAAFFTVVGLAFGSIASMFLNSDVYALYVSWGKNGVDVVTVIISAVLLVIGFIGSWLLTKYELSRE
jgi:putative membrane protein